MASGILRGAVSFVPAHLFIFELLAGSSVVGLTAPTSAARPLGLPLIAASVYGIVKTAAHYMRPRWASLLGGLSFAFLLRYVDVALITRWDYDSQGPAANIAPQRESNVKAKQDRDANSKRPALDQNASIWTRLWWGWNLLWSFRQVNTPYEVRNSPRFSSSDPSYVPSKWPFVGRNLVLASVCYLVLDILAQRPPPSNAASLFNPALVPFFRRLGAVTWPQIKLRLLSIVMFGITFYCVIQGAYSFAAAIATGTGLSEVSSWRPPFGAISDAFTLRNFWGKVWHQNLRRLVGAPASYIVYNLLGLQRSSAAAAAMATTISFAISGVMHLAAGHSSGMPLDEMGVVQFFCTQAFGIILETAVGQLLWPQKRDGSEADSAPPSAVQRVLGYCWVLAFLAWSGPMWLYPQMARQGPQAGSNSFVPYSVVQAWKAR